MAGTSFTDQATIRVRMIDKYLLLWKQVQFLSTHIQTRARTEQNNININIMLMHFWIHGDFPGLDMGLWSKLYVVHLVWPLYCSQWLVSDNVVILFFFFSLVLFFFFSPFCVCLEPNHTHALLRVEGLELLVVCHCHANSKTDGWLTPLSGPCLMETEEETVKSLVPSLIGSRTWLANHRWNPK